MLKIDVLSWEKKKISSLSLDQDIFAQKTRLDIISDIVRWQLARRRQGSHSVKTRADVRGGGAKPFRQKGTGRARQGSIRSPLLRKGGVAHGPHPRSYATDLPSKVRKIGMRSLLSYFYSKKLLFVVENMISKDGKTKELNIRLNKFGLDQALLVDQKKDAFFARACKNLPSYQFIHVQGLNVYDLLKYGRVVFTENGINEVSRIFKKKNLVKKAT